MQAARSGGLCPLVNITTARFEGHRAHTAHRHRPTTTDHRPPTTAAVTYPLAPGIETKSSSKTSASFGKRTLVGSPTTQPVRHAAGRQGVLDGRGLRKKLGCDPDDRADTILLLTCIPSLPRANPHHNCIGGYTDAISSEGEDTSSHEPVFVSSGPLVAVRCSLRHSMPLRVGIPLTVSMSHASAS